MGNTAQSSFLKGLWHESMLSQLNLFQLTFIQQMGWYSLCHLSNLHDNVLAVLQVRVSENC